MNISQIDVHSLYFFGLKKKNGQGKDLHSLRTGSCSKISESSEIRKYAVGFYKNLYFSEWSSKTASLGVSLRSVRTTKQAWAYKSSTVPP